MSPCTCQFPWAARRSERLDLLAEKGVEGGPRFSVGPTIREIGGEETVKDFCSGGLEPVECLQKVTLSVNGARHSVHLDLGQQSAAFRVSKTCCLPLTADSGSAVARGLVGDTEAASQHLAGSDGSTFGPAPGSPVLCLIARMRTGAEGGTPARKRELAPP